MRQFSKVIILWGALSLIAFSPILFALFVVLAPSSASAQTTENSQDWPDLLFVLDVSGSMGDYVDEGYKLGLAIEALDETYINYTDAGGTAAVLAYEGDCASYWTDSNVLPSRLDQWLISDWPEEKNILAPGGSTPTDVALAAALHYLGYFDEYGNPTVSGDGTIILISDGASTCSDPCEVVESSSINITVHTVGFLLAGDADALNELACIADSTGGVALSVEEAEDLSEVLEELIILNIAIKIKEVQAFGDSLITDIEVRNVSPKALYDANLRIEGPEQLIDGRIVNSALGDVKQKYKGDLRFIWNSNICDSLDEPLRFTISGAVINKDGERQGEKLAPYQIMTGDLLLLADGEEGIYDRCDRDYSSDGDLNIILSEDGNSDTDSLLSIITWAQFLALFGIVVGVGTSFNSLTRRSSSSLQFADITSNASNILKDLDLSPKTQKVLTRIGYAATVLATSYLIADCIANGNNSTDCVEEVLLNTGCLLAFTAGGATAGSFFPVALL